MGGGVTRRGQSHGGLYALSGTFGRDGWWVCPAASDHMFSFVSVLDGGVSPTVGKIPEIIPRALQVSRLKNSLSESCVIVVCCVHVRCDWDEVILGKA